MKTIVFTARWCAPCKVYKPTLEEVIKENPNVDIEFIDVGNDPDKLMEKYSVSSVPTTLVFEGNDIICRKVGNVFKDELLKILNIGD